MRVFSKLTASLMVVSLALSMSVSAIFLANAPEVNAANAPIFLDAQNFTDANSAFDDSKPVKMSGHSVLSNNSIRLVNATDGRAGGVFTTKSIAQGTGFSAAFAMSFGNDFLHYIPADGFTFIVAKKNNKIGVSGEDLGYGGITNSIAVEYDTYNNTLGVSKAVVDLQNPAVLSAATDTPHIALDKNGVVSSDSIPHAPNVVVYKGDNGNTSFAYKKNYSLNFWADYDAATDTLYFYIGETTTRPANPIATYPNVGIDDIGDTYHIGITSATGYHGQATSLDKLLIKNQFESASLDFTGIYTEDSKAPKIGSITSDGSNFTITSPDADIDKIQYKIDAGNWTDYSNPVPHSGNAEITARAIDTAGNISSELVVPFAVTAPTVEDFTASVVLAQEYKEFIPEVPAVTGSGIFEKGWQISIDGTSDWAPFDPATANIRIATVDNRFLRYCAKNIVGEACTTNNMQISVALEDPDPNSIGTYYYGETVQLPDGTYAYVAQNSYDYDEDVWLYDVDQYVDDSEFSLNDRDGAFANWMNERNEALSGNILNAGFLEQWVFDDLHRVGAINAYLNELPWIEDDWDSGYPCVGDLISGDITCSEEVAEESHRIHPTYSFPKYLLDDLRNFPDDANRWSSKMVYDSKWFFDEDAISAGVGATKENPYIISYPAQFAGLQDPALRRKIKNGAAPVFIKIGADIDLREYIWDPINIQGAAIDNFLHIDGDGRAISGLKVDSFTTSPPIVNLQDFEYEFEDARISASGLFGSAEYIQVKNLILDEPSVKLASVGKEFTNPHDRPYNVDSIGALAGYAAFSAFDNVVVNDPVVTPETSSCSSRPATLSVGGLVGYAGEDLFMRHAAVKGGSVSIECSNGEYNYLGGLVGNAYKALILNSYTATKIVSTNNNVAGIFIGGIAGASATSKAISTQSASCIINSYSASQINATDSSINQGFYLGGIAGFLDDTAVNTYFSGSTGTDVTEYAKYSHIGHEFGFIQNMTNADDDADEHTIKDNYYYDQEIGYSCGRYWDGTDWADTDFYYWYEFGNSSASCDPDTSPEPRSLEDYVTPYDSSKEVSNVSLLDLLNVPGVADSGSLFTNHNGGALPQVEQTGTQGVYNWQNGADGWPTFCVPDSSNGCEDEYKHNVSTDLPPTTQPDPPAIIENAIGDFLDPGLLPPEINSPLDPNPNDGIDDDDSIKLEPVDAGTTLQEILDLIPWPAYWHDGSADDPVEYWEHSWNIHDNWVRIGTEPGELSPDTLLTDTQYNGTYLRFCVEDSEGKVCTPEAAQIQINERIPEVSTQAATLDTSSAAVSHAVSVANFDLLSNLSFTLVPNPNTCGDECEFITVSAANPTTDTNGEITSTNLNIPQNTQNGDYTIMATAKDGRSAVSVGIVTLFGAIKPTPTPTPTPTPNPSPTPTPTEPPTPQPDPSQTPKPIPNPTPGQSQAPIPDPDSNTDSGDEGNDTSSDDAKSENAKDEAAPDANSALAATGIPALQIQIIRAMLLILISVFVARLLILHSGKRE